MNKLKFTCGELEEKVRLDVFLSSMVDKSVFDVSRSRAKNLIKDSKVEVNGKIEKSHHLLHIGDVITVEPMKPVEMGLEAEDLEIPVIYEDKDVVVVNKPSGMVVHPTDSGHNQTGTLVNALLFHCKDLSGIGGVMRPGIVHRLDKGTSGVLIVAKNDVTHRNLSKQIQDREVKKIYLTLVKGRLKPEEGSIDAPVGRSLMDRKKMAVIEHQTSRHALTHYKVIRYFTVEGIGVGATTYSLVEVSIVTGRTHQIRVHFQAIGYPVVGDPTYGDSKVNSLFRRYGLDRPFLHAHKLSIKLPTKDAMEEFEADLPKDLAELISKLSE